MYILGRWKSCHKDFFVCTFPQFPLNPSYLPLQRVGVCTLELEKQHFENLSETQTINTTQDRKISHSQQSLLTTIKCEGTGAD